MNTDEARYFLAICEHGSVNQAATALYISPQGLSRSLKRLETKLGIRLFVRSAQGMMLTEQAKQLKPLFKQMTQAEDEVYAYLGNLKRAERTRYLIGRDSMLGDVVMQGVEDYNNLHGEDCVKAMMLRENEERLAKIFMEGGYDYRFLSSETDDLSELPQEEICTLRFIPLFNCESEIVKKGRFAFSDLRDLTVITEYRSFAWVKILEKHCQKLGFELRVREVDKDYIARLLSRPGKEVTFIRQLDVSRDPWSRECYSTPSEYEPLDAHIVLQTVHREVDQELVDCIRTKIASSPYASQNPAV